jgi:hypothetical protein
LLSNRSKVISLAAAVICGISILSAGGQLASGAAANESAKPVPPYARTAFAYGISSTEAVLVGYVNARGSETTARFQLGRSKSYGRFFPLGPPEHRYYGHHRSEIEAGVGPLRPGTTYHFRIVAKSAGRKAYGKDQTFKTLPR